MTTVQWIGVGCLVYFVLCAIVAGVRPPMVWKIAKIQAFVSLLGETGARILIGGVGVVAGAAGVYLLWFFGG
jgi:hypothetical protein